MRRAKTILLIVGFKGLVVIVLAVVSTWLCRRYGLTADFPMTLIATAVVFPIVFSISGAYKRRESALDEYGALKAHGRAIYYAARDWLGEADGETLERARRLLGDLLRSLRKLFTEPIEAMPPNEDAVYRGFSRLSLFIRQDLRGKGLATGEVSRCNQYLSKMLVAFESIKHIYQYRTPRTLRGFSDVFITVLPPLYGPYFAYLAQEYSSGLEYVMPVLFAAVLVSLDGIQDHLEDPFDQIGEDDVAINAEKFLRSLDL